MPSVAATQTASNSRGISPPMSGRMRPVGALSGGDQGESVPTLGEPSVAARGHPMQRYVDVIVDAGQLGALLGRDPDHQIGQPVEGHCFGVPGVFAAELRDVTRHRRHRFPWIFYLGGGEKPDVEAPDCSGPQRPEDRVA